MEAILRMQKHAAEDPHVELPWRPELFAFGNFARGLEVECELAPWIPSNGMIMISCALSKADSTLSYNAWYKNRQWIVIQNDGIYVDLGVCPEDIMSKVQAQLKSTNRNPCKKCWFPFAHFLEILELHQQRDPHMAFWLPGSTCVDPHAQHFDPTTGHTSAVKRSQTATKQLKGW